MALHYNPRTITTGLYFYLDAGDINSYPTRGIATTWTDYNSQQANYSVIGTDGIYIKSTYTGWIGYFPAVVTSTGYYTVMFDYVGDSNGTLVLDNDGIVDNQYNASISVTTSVQTFVKSINIDTTGDIRHYLRRGDGGNITVTNFRFFKSGTLYDLSGNSRTANIANGVLFSKDNKGILNFDGSNDYITMNSAANDYAWTANGSVGSSTMCYELWYKTTDTSGLLISKPWNGSGRYNILVSPGNFSLLVGTGVYQGGDQSNGIDFPASADNNWHQLVIWASSTQMGYYLDGGASKGTINHGLTGGASDFGNAGLPLGIMSLYFYGEGWSGNTGFSIEGSISIFRSYRRILSEAEVLQNYNAQKSRFNI